jgi:hypothetical protein
VAALCAGKALADSGFDFDFSPVVVKSDDGRVFWFYLHKGSGDKLMIQPRPKLSFTDAPANWPENVWRHAVEYFVRPIGCTVSDVHPMSRLGGTWSATLACPPEVHFRELYAAQRDALKRGEPLHP